MSELDPKVKADLVKQIEDIAKGKGEIGVGGSAVADVTASNDATIVSNENERVEQSVPAQAPVQTDVEPIRTEPVVESPVAEKPVEEPTASVVEHPIVGQPSVNHGHTVQPIPQPAVQSPTYTPPTQVSPPMTQHVMQQPVYQQPVYQPVAAPVEKKKKKDDKIDSMMVFVFVLLLALGGLFVMSRFGGGLKYPQQYQQYPQQQYPNNNFQFNNSPYQPYPQEFQGPHLNPVNPVDPYQNPHSPTLEDIKSYLAPWIDQRIGHLERRVDRLDHRTWLLAVANNENSAISKRLAERVGASDLGRKYISFDGNWNLNKMPEFIRLTSEQRYNLLEEVDDTNYQRRYEYEYDYRTHEYRPVYNHDYRSSSSCYPSSTTTNYCYPSNMVRSCQPTYYNYSYNSCNSGAVKRYLCRPGRVFNWGFCH